MLLLSPTFETAFLSTACDVDGVGVDRPPHGRPMLIVGRPPLTRMMISISADELAELAELAVPGRQFPHQGTAGAIKRKG